MRPLSSGTNGNSSPSECARFKARTVQGGFPSGQRGQTVNLMALPSQVRILYPPMHMLVGLWLFIPVRRTPNNAGVAQW